MFYSCIHWMVYVIIHIHIAVSCLFLCVQLCSSVSGRFMCMFWCCCKRRFKYVLCAGLLCVMYRFTYVLCADFSRCHVRVLVCAMYSLQWRTFSFCSEHASLRSAGRERQGWHMISCLHKNKREPPLYMHIHIYIYIYIYVWAAHSLNLEHHEMYNMLRKIREWCTT